MRSTNHRLAFILCLSLLSITVIDSADSICRIKCGIINDQRGTTSLQNFASTVWEDLKFAKALNSVEIHFVRIKRRIGMTMDELIEAYMEIGTTNISALIGPYSQPTATATEKFGIPYLLTTDVEEGRYAPYNLMSVFPKPSDLYNIAVDVVNSYRWSAAAVFYETSDGVHLLEHLVRSPNTYVRAWKIDNMVGHEQLRNFLLNVRQLRITNIIVMSSRIVTSKLLEQALHLSMLSERYSWIIPALNQDSSTLREFTYTQVNLTTFHLEQQTLPENGPGAGYFTQFEYATIYDSLLTLYHGVRSHHRNRGNCHWAGKDHLLPELSRISGQGATGKLSFKPDGTRQGYTVNVLSLESNGLVQEPPYVRLKQDHRRRLNNDKYEGFCIDLLREVSAMLDFRYEIYLVPDGKFGNKLRDGTWNGLVQQIMNGFPANNRGHIPITNCFCLHHAGNIVRVDFWSRDPKWMLLGSQTVCMNATLAVASLTITSGREEVVDFSKPFTTLGISMALSRPEERMYLFQFLSPLSPLVWLLLLAVFVLISTVLYLVDRVAPAEDANIRFNIQDAIWFTFGSLVLSGTDTVPRTISGRLLAGSLWFFALFMMASYTANLAAFLTVSRFNQNIRGLIDLVDQSKIRYGTVENTDVAAFFENSQLHHFQKMWQFMSTVDPGCMVNSSESGFKKAKESNGQYVFLWDSPVIKYKVDTDCDLVEIGEQFDSKGYGIGVPLGAQYRDDLSMAILKLGEKGRLEALRHKWWKRGSCPDIHKPAPSATTSLNIEKVSGLFIMLGVGIVMSLLACSIDFLYRQRRKAKKAKNRKVLEKTSSSKLCDGALASTTEEPFLPNCNTSIHCNQYIAPPKQTNIF